MSAMTVAAWDAALDALDTAAIPPTPAMVALLKRVRQEIADWQDALCGEREGLDELCAEIDVALGLPVMPLEWGE